MEQKELTAAQKRDLKQGHAVLLKCYKCDTKIFYGAMQQISLAISAREPACDKHK